MTRLSDKTIRQQTFNNAASINSSFIDPEFIATVRDKGVSCIFEKAYLCPCKSKESTPLNTCKNCGGVGWLFCNPIQTKMIVTGIGSDNKLKEAALRDWGLIDGGSVNLTAHPDNKFSYMDKVTNIDATSEHNETLYPAINDAEDQYFVYTQYNILSIDNIVVFVDIDEKLRRLSEGDDYLFRDNVILFTDTAGITVNSKVSIRYVHNPVFHISYLVRESMTSYQGGNGAPLKKIILPIKAIALRAHLVKDLENFDGDRLLDNSWLPDACEAEALSKFVRQLKYTDANELYENLTQSQKLEIAMLINADDNILGVNGGVLQINP
jgi:hypothetical protein